MEVFDTFSEFYQSVLESEVLERFTRRAFPARALHVALSKSCDFDLFSPVFLPSH